MTVQAERSWFPGKVVPLARLTRFEILSPLHCTVRVQVGTDTIFGTPAQALATGLALVRAAMEADAGIAARIDAAQLRAVLPS